MKAQARLGKTERNFYIVTEPVKDDFNVYVYPSKKARDRALVRLDYVVSTDSNYFIIQEFRKTAKDLDISLYDCIVEYGLMP